MNPGRVDAAAATWILRRRGWFPRGAELEAFEEDEDHEVADEARDCHLLVLHLLVRVPVVDAQEADGDEHLRASLDRISAW